ncbi:peptide/nickel transport system substrate-binding protein [Arboricoccus pini]|uniref:Peptide/nickel transport system substrate-binding protein n=1 Tax=Arboricoccus pini TaxID=1963835 RepID=A0A212RVG4_9PROT|nr:peptide ABC transporter substrate-binding protein [Arboricoccus pini]SNB76749.1 peptide/nickel transport system substrate-binding protein [Arboricoccus pini]
MSIQTTNGLARRRLFQLGGAGLLAATLPRPVLAAGGKAMKGQIIAGLSQEPTFFNPLMPHIEVDEAVYWAIYSPLWGVDEKGDFIPQLATEIPTQENGGISADGLTWTVKLREGVKWHDGQPFSADDVKYTIDLLNNPDFRAAKRQGHELVTKVEVKSPTEIVWTMKEVYAPYAAILAWTFIVPKHVVEKAASANDSTLNTAPVGTGAFKWQERVAGDHITLAGNPDFFGDGPHVERLVIKYIPDLTVMYTQFQTGDIDHTGLQGITADHYEEASKLPDRVVQANLVATIENIGFNLGKPQFQDQAVREALYYAIDKQSLIDSIYYGLPKATESYLPQQSWAFNPDLPKQSYDPEKAKAILDAAGWKPGADGIREKNGVKLSFLNSTTAGNHLREQAQQLIQQNWGDIGVKMEIHNLPPAVMWGDYWMMSKFDSVIVGIGFMVGPDPDATDYFGGKQTPAKGGNGQNTTQYDNPEVNRLLAEAASTLDRAKRTQAYKTMQEHTRHDLPFLPLFQYTLIEGVKKGLNGFKASINVQSNLWNVRDWSWS